MDVINNMPLVRAFGATLRERERFAGRVESEMQARGQSLRYLERLRLFHAATTAVLTGGLLGWAILLWLHHQASTGDVVLVSTLGFTILHGTRDLAVALVDTVQYIARLSEALSTLLLPHEMGEAANARTLPAPQGAVAFRHVSYAYPAGAPVLRDFDLEIRPGTRIGLVGRSGSGKSTALALLQRLRDVQRRAGADRRRGREPPDRRQPARRDLGGAAGRLAVPPLGDGEHPLRPPRGDRRRRCAAPPPAPAASISSSCCPNGFDTIVGDRGVKLSGGQRQRVAIARAFLRNAPILLLDEATSALDSESEVPVQRALVRLMEGRTVIAVAHRLSTLRDFDRIVVMQEGRILQDGTPAELEQQPGLYAELLGRQSLRLVERAA